MMHNSVILKWNTGMTEFFFLSFLFLSLFALELFGIFDLAS
jgi:hypothetical protein